MIVSRAWLQVYFKEKLPDPEKIAELFTFGACEVENIEEGEKDTAFDLKVLPDRACYALSHRGIAYELSAIGDLPATERKSVAVAPTSDKKISVTVADPKDCPRYIARVIEGIVVKPSPHDLVEKIESVGQRAINNIVDATNFVMLDAGQPLHAFDADKLKGGITVRRATDGETIELLPERVVAADGTIAEKPRLITLASTDIVIADDKGPVALAGVKGGNRAAVTASTKNLIIESANFNPTLVRKTATKYNLRNDASKRFENALSPEWASIGMEEVTALIRDIASPKQIGPMTDVYSGKETGISITVNADDISRSLGTEIPQNEMEDIFRRLHIGFIAKGKEYALTPPWFRRDLVMAEDMVEEVGRIYGYGKIPAALPPKASVLPINKSHYWIEKVKDVAVSHGFSEVLTYALTSKGDIEIANPFASDKGFLRKDLSDGLQAALLSNSRNIDLLGLSQIRLFEVGNVFTKGGERLHFAAGVANQKGEAGKKEAEARTKLIADIAKLLTVDLEKHGKLAGSVFEADITDIIEKLPEPASWDVETKPLQGKYDPPSAYPFAVRDVAVFTPEGTTEDDVRDIIKNESGALLAREPRLFDVFTKAFPDGAKKTSYAFRMVFQSHERTLSETEINDVMKNITNALNGRQGWQVR